MGITFFDFIVGLSHLKRKKTCSRITRRLLLTGGLCLLTYDIYLSRLLTREISKLFHETLDELLLAFLLQKKSRNVTTLVTVVACPRVEGVAVGTPVLRPLRRWQPSRPMARIYRRFQSTPERHRSVVFAGTASVTNTSL